MNYNFFVANGFASGDMFKEAFIDKILSEILLNTFGIFLFTVAGVYHVWTRSCLFCS
jgi:hypothetical protein